MSTEVMGELREMAFHPRELFGNVSAICEERDFFYQTLVVGWNWQARFVNALEQRSPVFLNDVRVQAADFLNLFAHRFETPDQILGQMFAFALAHFDQFVERGAQ